MASEHRSEDERLAELLAAYQERISQFNADASSDSGLVEHFELTRCIARLGQVSEKMDWNDLDLGSDSVSPDQTAFTEGPQDTNGPAQTIGRFHIEGELGRGGLGIVLLALDPVLKRRVALKIPHLSALLSSSGNNRFEREAQAAARLTHPNIIPLLEVGNVGPIAYLASAFSEGHSLAEWLKGRRAAVPFDEAVALVRDLAKAMDYAHKEGILHRDLKPGNIILEPRPLSTASSSGRENATVASRDSLGSYTPKITDFGLAKIVGESIGETRSGTVLGTPAYMAPEQARGETCKLDATADVYALGAIFYELLTGRAPFVGGSESEILLHVMNDEPTSPKRLRPDLPNDLEAVILKCLEKEPERRYSSAGELAAELTRYLDREPLLVRPIGPAGRTWRQARKYPLTATLLATVAVLLVATTAVTTTAYFQAKASLAREQKLVAEANRNRDEAVASEKRARESEALARSSEQQAKEAQLASQVAEARAEKESVTAKEEANVADKTTEFLVGLFRSADPLGLDSIGLRVSDAEALDSLSALELLKRGRERIETDLADAPKAQARLYETLGSVYGLMARYDDAVTLFDKALELTKAEYGEQSQEAARLLQQIGQVELWTFHTARALELFRTCLLIQEPNLPPSDPGLLKTKFLIAITRSLIHPQLDLEVSKSYLQEILAHRDSLTSTESDRRLLQFVKTVLLYVEMEIQSDERSQLERLRAMSEILDQGESLLVVWLFNYWNASQKARTFKRWDEFEKIYAKIDKLLIDTWGEESNLISALIRGDMASIFMVRGNSRKSLELAVPVMYFALRLLPHHSKLGKILDDTAALLHTKGDFDELRRLLQLARQQGRAVNHYEPGNRWTPCASGSFADEIDRLGNCFTKSRASDPTFLDYGRMNVHARYLTDSGRVADATQVAEPFRSLGAQINRFSQFELLLACEVEAFRENGEFDVMRSKIEEMRVSLRHQNLYIGPDFNHLLSTSIQPVPLRYRGNPFDSRILYFHQYGVMERFEDRYYDSLNACLGLSFPPDHPLIVTMQLAYCRVLDQLGRSDEIENLWRECVDTLRRMLGEDHLKFMIVEADLSEFLARQGQLEEADRRSLWAVEAARKRLPADHPWIEPILRSRAKILSILGKHAEAAPLFEERDTLIAKHYGPLYLEYAEAVVERAECLDKLKQTSEAIRILEAAHAPLAEKLPEKNWRVHWLAGEIARRKAQLDPAYAPAAKEITARTAEILTLAWGDDHELPKRFGKPVPASEHQTVGLGADTSTEQASSP